jgi:hypothetical protein
MVGAFVLTFLTWIFFYVETPDAPLTAAGTVVVFGFCFGMVAVVHWGWRKYTRKRARKDT